MSKESKGKLSRREFLNVLALGASASVVFGCGSSLTTESKSVGEILPDPGVEIYNSLDILRGIKNKYGVEIPLSESSEFAREVGGVIQYNSVPSYEESSLIERTVHKIPAAYVLGDLVLLYRDNNERIGGPAYLGRNWPFHIRRSRYSEKNISELSGYLSEKSAIKIMLPDRGTKLTEPTPEVGNPLDLLPPLDAIALHTAVAKRNIKLNLPQEVLKEDTYGSVIEKNLLHEYGHGFVDYFSRETSASYKDYTKKKGLSIVLQAPIYVDHPIYVSWAQVNKWRLRGLTDFIADYDPDAAEALARERKKAGQDELQVWDRDPGYWGDLGNRKPRISLGFTYRSIEESFADGWAAAILKPNLLTREENQYYQNIFRGLREDPGTLVKYMSAQYG